MRRISTGLCTPPPQAITRTVAGCNASSASATVVVALPAGRAAVFLGEAGCGKAQGFYFAKPMFWADESKLIEKEKGA